MADLGVLETFVQLPVGLIGFKGVVSALGKSRPPMNARAFRIRALLLYGTTALPGSIFPIVFESFELSGAMFWGPSGLPLTQALAGVFFWLGIFVRQLTSEGQLPSLLAKSLRATAIMVVLLLIGGLAFARAALPAIYLVAFSWTLGMGVFHFHKLVMSIQRQGDKT